MSLKKRLAKTYSGLVYASMGENHPLVEVDIPESVQRYYNNLIGFEYAYFIGRLVGDKEKVLLIGDGGGRDYYYLRMRGKDVTAIDIARQSVIDRLVLTDVASSLPFPDATFDAVVMAEVIEHLFEDYEALGHIRRVMRADAKLVLTVPYGHDIPEYHVRVHTARTIRRLLEYSGFKIVDIIEKGALHPLERSLLYTYLKHGLNFLFYSLLGRTFYQRWNLFLANIDWYWGHNWKWIHRWSRYYGAFLACVKSDVRPDFTQMNIDEFTDYMRT